MSNQFISNKRQKLKEKKVWVCRVRVPKQLHQMLEKYPSGKEYLYSISQAHYTLRVLLRGFGFSGFGVTIRILTLAVKKLSNQVQQCKNDPIHENPKTHAKKQQWVMLIFPSFCSNALKIKLAKHIRHSNPDILWLTYSSLI